MVSRRAHVPDSRIDRIEEVPADDATEQTEGTPTGGAEQSEGTPTGGAVEHVSDADDEFAGVTVVKVEKVGPAVTPLDKIPASVRQYVALATTDGPQLIIVHGWDAAKRKKFTALVKKVQPHLPGGQRIKVAPQKHKGQDAIGISVYTPRAQKAAATTVPAVKTDDAKESA